MKQSFWKQAVAGIADGMIISLVLTTAIFISTQKKETVVVTAGIAAIAGALLIGIGGYYAAKFRMESLTAKTEEEEKELNAAETAKTIALFKQLNLGSDMQEQAAIEIEKDSAEWKAFLQKNEQQFELPDKKQLPVIAFIIGLSYFAGAVFPLLIFGLNTDAGAAFKYALIATLIALPIVGYIKSYVNAEPLIWGTIRPLLLGAAAVTCAWLVATIFFHTIP